MAAPAVVVAVIQLLVLLLLQLKDILAETLAHHQLNGVEQAAVVPAERGDLLLELYQVHLEEMVKHHLSLDHRQFMLAAVEVVDICQEILVVQVALEAVVLVVLVVPPLDLQLLFLLVVVEEEEGCHQVVLEELVDLVVPVS